MIRMLAVALVIMPISLFGQDPPTHEKKMFLSPEGKLYTNHDLPLYLWISTSPGSNSEKHLLQSEKSEKYTNPMYFDTEGYNTFRSPSAVDTVTKKVVYPLQDIIFEVYNDGTAPTTKITYGAYSPYKQEGKLYLKNNTKVELQAIDKLSGTQAIYYSIDGEPYKEYTAPISFSEQREYVLKFYAVDNVGNAGKIREVRYVYDKSSPVTKSKIDTDEHNNVLSARSHIELEAEDVGIGVNKIVYRIDEGKEYTYQSPLKAYNISQGEHKLTYYAVDKSGNKETPKTYTFYVDKTPPTIIEEVIAKTFFANGKEYASGKAQLKLTAFDNKAGVKEIRYSINGGEFQVYDKPVFLSNTSGSLNIITYATDNVNNKSTGQTANEKTAIPYIDLSGPSLKHSFKGPQFNTRDTLFINKTTKIYLKGYDAEAGINRIEYRVDGENNLAYTEGFSIEKEGVHTINFVGYDNVENSNSAEFMVKVDNTGPEIGHKFSAPVVKKIKGAKSYPKYVILFLSGVDNVVGLETIKYRFSASATPKAYTLPVHGFSSGEKSMQLIAYDKLGNKTEQNITFHIEP